MSGLAPGALSAAILEVARATPNCRLRHILTTLTPQGFNGHSIRTTVTTLVRGGALLCNRHQQPAGYSVPVKPAGGPMTQRVLALLAEALEPVFVRDIIAAFPEAEPFAIRNALVLLQENGRVDRVGKRHQFGYFATGVELTSQGGRAVIGCLVHARPNTHAPEPALAPDWPRPAGSDTAALLRSGGLRSRLAA